MNDIKRISISGESGYGPCEEAYTDKVTIEPNAIRYEYLPLCESETNPTRKWAYRTTSPIFSKLFDEVCVLVTAAMYREIIDICTDIGSINFRITHTDGKKECKTFLCPGEEFKECFSIIKKMVPDCEYVPAVLLTDDDYEE